MENITRTIFGSKLQTCLLMGLPFVMEVNTTLNERFGIQNGIAPGEGIIPTMRYYCIGNGGHTFTVGAGGRTKPEPIQHRGTDAGLYSPIPFVLREIENDLDVVERTRYALRRLETHQSRQYVAYYLKRLELTSVAAGMELINVVDGVSSVTAFVPDSSNLNPTPPLLSSTGVNTVTGEYVSATAKIGLIFSAADIAELLNVGQVIYDDPEMAIISEVGLCSGVNKNVQSPSSGGTTINFNEAIAVQVVSHINTFKPAAYINNGSEILLDVGATEPLFFLQ
jgi:hypothetical protein